MQLNTADLDIALPLQNGDIVLRAPQLSDAPRMAEYLGDLQVAGNLANVPHPYHLANAQDWLEKQAVKPSGTNFAIEHARYGYVGAIGFRYTDDEETVLGYWLGRPYWNKGIMTKAVTTALDWHFTTTDADRILSGVFHFNMASLAIQQKLGFVETGRSEAHCLARGQVVEHIDTELTRDAFELTRASYSDGAGRDYLRSL